MIPIFQMGTEESPVGERREALANGSTGASTQGPAMLIVLPAACLWAAGTLGLLKGVPEPCRF